MNALLCGIIRECFHSFVFHRPCLYFVCVGWIFIFLLPSLLDGFTPFHSTLTEETNSLLLPLHTMISLFFFLSSPNDCHLLQMDPLFAE